VLGSGGVWLFRGENFVRAWQLLFMLGIVIGYYLPAIEKWFRGLSRTYRRRIAVTLSSFTIITILASALIVIVATYFAGPFSNFAQLPRFLQTIFLNLDNFQKASDPWVNKWTLEPGRVIMALIWFTTFYMWFRRFEQSINRITRGYLKTLGECSLFVYGVHGVLVFFTLIILPGYYGYVLSTLITAAGLAVLYIAARYRAVPKTYIRKLLVRMRPVKTVL
jgi:hypothetical protein